MRRQRPRGSQLGLLLLASQLFQVGLDNIPPVTMGVLGLNVYLYLFPAAPLMQACVSVQKAYWYGDWRRLLLSPFHHVDDWHLYFNLTSFLWKGINLERRLGGAWFFYVLSVFSLLTGLVYLGLEAGLTELTDDPSYSVQCAVGFSGVLFALKILSNHYHPGGVTYVLGLRVDNRYASWVELVLIHITNPGTSLIGHLAGILVGLLYTTGPLKSIMKMCAGLGTRSGDSAEGEYAGGRRDYTGGMTEQEQYDRALRNSLNDTAGSRPADAAPPAYGFHLSDEEVRRRRLMRFDR
ncbi:unnamed protein product [Lota lota]